MIEFLIREIEYGGDTGWTISQRGGGAYREVTLVKVDSTGIVCVVKDARRFIPWTSINEIYR